MGADAAYTAPALHVVGCRMAGVSLSADHAVLPFRPEPHGFHQSCTHVCDPLAKRFLRHTAVMSGACSAEPTSLLDIVRFHSGTVTRSADNSVCRQAPEPLGFHYASTHLGNSGMKLSPRSVRVLPGADSADALPLLDVGWAWTRIVPLAADHLVPSANSKPLCLDHTAAEFSDALVERPLCSLRIILSTDSAPSALHEDAGRHNGHLMAN